MSKYQKLSLLVYSITIFLLWWLILFIVKNGLTLSTFFILISSIVLSLISLYIVRFQQASLKQEITFLSDLLSEINVFKKEEKSIETTTTDYNTLFKSIKNTNNITDFANEVLSLISNPLQLCLGLFYVYNPQDADTYKVVGQYAMPDDYVGESFNFADGFNGEAVRTKNYMIISDIPENYFVAYSGLGKSLPKHIILIPIIKDDFCYGLLELAVFNLPSKEEIKTLFENCNLLAEHIKLLNS